MTTAAMMRASTATNAPATDVTGDVLATVGGGLVLVDVVVGGVLGVSVLKEENIKLMLSFSQTRQYH